MLRAEMNHSNSTAGLNRTTVSAGSPCPERIARRRNPDIEMPPDDDPAGDPQPIPPGSSRRPSIDDPPGINDPIPIDDPPGNSDPPPIDDPQPDKQQRSAATVNPRGAPVIAIWS
jgi:hypothetical protein